MYISDTLSLKEKSETYKLHAMMMIDAFQDLQLGHEALNFTWRTAALCPSESLPSICATAERTVHFINGSISTLSELTPNFEWERLALPEVCMFLESATFEINGFSAVFVSVWPREEEGPFTGLYFEPR
jgi:hypothetical protein